MSAGSMTPTEKRVQQAQKRGKDKRKERLYEIRHLKRQSHPMRLCSQILRDGSEAQPFTGILDGIAMQWQLSCGQGRQKHTITYHHKGCATKEQIRTGRGNSNAQAHCERGRLFGDWETMRFTSTWTRAVTKIKASAGAEAGAGAGAEAGAGANAASTKTSVRASPTSCSGTEIHLHSNAVYKTLGYLFPKNNGKIITLMDLTLQLVEHGRPMRAVLRFVWEKKTKTWSIYRFARHSRYCWWIHDLLVVLGSLELRNAHLDDDLHASLPRKSTPAKIRPTKRTRDTM